MWSLIGKNNHSKTLYFQYCQTKRDLLDLPRLVKKAMENKCWKERDGTYAFRKVDMCKCQMGDPETLMKFSLSDCKWLEKIVVWTCLQSSKI
jgi:hypothetical protein